MKIMLHNNSILINISNYFTIINGSVVENHFEGSTSKVIYNKGILNGKLY